MNAYSFWLTLSFIVGFVGSLRESKKFSIAHLDILRASLFIFPSALIGAKVFFFVALGYWSWEEFIFHGGLVFYGALIFGILALYFYCRFQKISFQNMCNLVAGPLCAAQIIGRIGCLWVGCCHGKSCAYPWAITYTSSQSLAPLNTALHPTQIYEIIGLTVIVFLILNNNSRPHPRFNSAKIYLYSYAVLRFFVEFWRGDEVRGHWLYFSTSQWIALFFILCLLLLDFLSSGDHKRSHDET
jgi:phosphatidylglycerol:prolipoprotein diacylglycerol transferase